MAIQSNDTVSPLSRCSLNLQNFMSLALCTSVASFPIAMFAHAMKILPWAPLR
jgi:hypothetical protein